MHGNAASTQECHNYAVIHGLESSKNVTGKIVMAFHWAVKHYLQLAKTVSIG